MTESHPLVCDETAQTLLAQWRPHWDLSKSYLIEKSPPTLLRTRLFQALFPNSYFIVIVRHPAAIALATYNALASFGAAQGLTVYDLIEHWLLCHEIFLADAPHLNRLRIISYEHFVARPQSTLDSLYAFLDLPAHPLSEEIESDRDIAYLNQWRAMHQDLQRRQEIEQAMQLEPRVRTLGYSLADWSVSRPIKE